MSKISDAGKINESDYDIQIFNQRNEPMDERTDDMIIKEEQHEE